MPGNCLKRAGFHAHRSPRSGQARQPNSGLISIQTAEMQQIRAAVAAGEIGRRVMTGRHICERTGRRGRGPVRDGDAQPDVGGEAQVYRWSSRWMIIAAAVCALAAACGRSANSSPGSVSPVKGLVSITPAGAKPVPSVVWATNRDVISLDPLYDAGYPEYTADSLMCEPLLRQAPDGSMEPGLATVANPSPTTMVFTLRRGVRFWDGHPVTPADVVYSLDRQMNPKLGGYSGADFSRVASITATGQSQVTIKLKQADYWLEGELSSIPGIVIEKSFAEKEGKNYGTPAGSIMCTGAYMFKSW